MGKVLANELPVGQHMGDTTTMWPALLLSRLCTHPEFISTWDTTCL